MINEFPLKLRRHFNQDTLSNIGINRKITSKIEVITALNLLSYFEDE